jgi:hypothetical protein
MAMHAQGVCCHDVCSTHDLVMLLNSWTEVNVWLCDIGCSTPLCSAWHMAVTAMCQGPCLVQG